MWERALAYYEARGLPWRTWGTRVKGDKFWEEARELRKALRRFNRDWPQGIIAVQAEEVQHEIADVAITLAWIAHCFDTTIEECIDTKTAIDHGRGAGAHYKAGT